jgi:transcriptional regulator of acetoin/glycerol metabolism
VERKRIEHERKHMNTKANTKKIQELDDGSSEPRPKNWAAVQTKRALRPSKEAMMESIKASNANVSEAARRLGVDRATL